MQQQIKQFKLNLKTCTLFVDLFIQTGISSFIINMLCVSITLERFKTPCTLLSTIHNHKTKSWKRSDMHMFYTIINVMAVYALPCMRLYNTYIR